MSKATQSRQFLEIASAVLVVSTAAGCAHGPTYAPFHAAITTRLSKFIQHEMEDKGLPALSIALVRDQEVVWAVGFGKADPKRDIPATPRTIYRVGSVSKLFTDIGVMQLVEQGQIDLDAPITTYLPDLRLRNPFDKQVTLRQLMSHRAGLIREPPVGHYFDDSGPSLAQTVASLNGARVVYAPESRTKYSNAGIAVVGYVLERLSGEPFTAYLKRAVLDPMGMDATAFEPNDDVRRNLAKAIMWGYDGREFQAPTFELGTSPAGSMYSSVLDLARFMSVLFNDGRGPNGQVIQADTLALMLTPQYAGGSGKRQFGIGFAISKFDGHRRCGHGGAIYGFATELAFLPDQKIGVVVVTTLDCANTVTRRVADEALRLMLLDSGTRLTQSKQAPLSRKVDPVAARLIEGRYACCDRSIEFVERNGGLFAYLGGKRIAVRSLGDKLILDGRLRYGPTISIHRDDGIQIGNDVFRRVDDPKPTPIPQKWKGLIGEYGWDHNVLFVLEKEGRLHALIEWFYIDPLREVSADVFALPEDEGLYPGERLVFKRDANGRAIEASLGGVVFERRSLGADEGETFRIHPLKPVEQLRREALAAQPPIEPGNFRKPDLVELSSLDPTIKLDIRYATTNNFMSTIFYEQPKAYLQRPAAEAVVRAHRELKEYGYGLLIHDAYRPWYVTKMFWDATPDDKKHFVADPAKGSNHNRGCAVDLTLFDLETGEPVQMVGGYDEMTERSYPDYQGGTSLQRWHRELLRDVMEAHGFTVYKFEWWHFNHKDLPEHAIQDLTFEEIEAQGGR